MRRTGLIDTIGEERWFLSDEAAVAAPQSDVRRGGARSRANRRRPRLEPERRLAESRVRPEGEPGHDDDRDDGQRENEDVARRLRDPRGAAPEPAPPELRSGSPGRCHREDIVGTPVGGTSAPSHSPAASPPRCAALSMVPPDAKPNTMLITIRNISWLTIPRLCRSTGWWMRPAVSRMPNSPKIAPDAPTDGTSPPNTKLATEPAAAQAR